jgi:hypothetical protein
LLRVTGDLAECLLGIGHVLDTQIDQIPSNGHRERQRGCGA